MTALLGLLVDGCVSPGCVTQHDLNRAVENIAHQVVSERMEQESSNHE